MNSLFHISTWHPHIYIQYTQYISRIYNMCLIKCTFLMTLTFVLQAALPVGLALGLAVALQALVLQQGFLSLQLPQTRLQTLSAAHLKSIIKYFVKHVL